VADTAHEEALWSRLQRRLAGEGLGAVLVRGASGSAGINAAGGLLALLVQLILARQLGVTAFGHFVYAFTWVLVLSQLCRLGFQNSLVRFTAAYRVDGDWAGLAGLARRSLQLTLAAGLLAAAGLWAATAALAGHMAEPLVQTFRVAALLVVPLAVLGAVEGLLRGHRHPARALLPGRVVIPGGVIVLIAAAALMGEPGSAASAMGLALVAALAGLALGLYWCGRTLREPAAGVEPTYRTAYWLRVSIPILAMTGLNVLMKQTDTLMLGALADSTAAGLYFPVARLTDIVLLGALSINAILAPLISELHTSGERGRLQRVLRWSTTAAFAVTLAAVVVIWLAGEWILGLFGPAFPAGYPALVVLLTAQIVHGVCGPVALILTMTGQQDRASLVLVVTTGINAVLNAALIPAYGLMGAATATAISIAFWNVWMVVEVGRRLGVDPSVFAWRKRTRTK